MAKKKTKQISAEPTLSKQIDLIYDRLTIEDFINDISPTEITLQKMNSIFDILNEIEPEVGNHIYFDQVRTELNEILCDILIKLNKESGVISESEREKSETAKVQIRLDS